MCKFNPKNQGRRIDSCMKNIIDFLKLNDVKTVACCCGHGKYPMTIIVAWAGTFFEIFSYEEIKRKKRFYEKDKQGYYYIPEVILK